LHRKFQEEKKRIFDMKRILSLGFAALLLAIAALVLPTASAGTAHAATLTPMTDTTHCASLGTLIQTVNTYDDDNGELIGYLNVYYNSSNGYNCAEVTSASSTYGVSKGMMAAIMVCTQTSPSSTCTQYSSSKPYTDADENYYSYYAGPVGVYGVNHCIQAWGYIEWGGVNRYVETSGASHCS
jgi:hypothetical protein